MRYRKPDHSRTDKRGFRTKREAEPVWIALGELIDATSARTAIADIGAAWLQNQSHLKPSSQRAVEVAWRVPVEPGGGAFR